MPLREMKWRASRGLTFRALGSKALSGLNPGTRLAASPGDSEPRLGWERSRGLGAWEPGREGGCLGFRITANHRGIKMFTGCGGISCELMIFNVIIFLPHEFSLDSQSVME